MKSFRIILFLVSIVLIAEGCRPPRCKIPTCYVRMKHRHDGGKMLTTETNVTERGAASASLGKEYRGVPFWERNKNPKIGQGYKPGYKYNYKKGKWKKPAKQKQKQVDELQPEEGQEQIGEEEVAQEEKPAEKKGFFKRRKEKKQEEVPQEEPAQEPAQTPARKPEKQAPSAAEKDGF